METLDEACANEHASAVAAASCPTEGVKVLDECRPLRESRGRSRISEASARRTTLPDAIRVPSSIGHAPKPSCPAMGRRGDRRERHARVRQPAAVHQRGWPRARAIQRSRRGSGATAAPCPRARAEASTATSSKWRSAPRSTSGSHGRPKDLTSLAPVRSRTATRTASGRPHDACPADARACSRSTIRQRSASCLGGSSCQGGLDLRLRHLRLLAGLAEDDKLCRR